MSDAPSVDPERPQVWALPRGLLLAAAPIAVLLVLGLAALGALALDQARELEAKLGQISVTVDANVRVPSQTQRELLRLTDSLRNSPLDHARIELHRAFVTQRMVEMTRDSQVPVLALPELVDEAKRHAAHWRDVLEPQVDELIRQRSVTAPPQLLAELVALELDVNRMVAATEIARRQQAGEVRDNAVQLLTRTRFLLAGVASVFLLLLALLGIGGLIWRRFDRRRAEDTLALTSLNRGLKKLSEVAARTDNPVVITDAKGRIEWVNEAFTLVTGYRLAEVIGRRPGAVLSGPETDALTGELIDRGVAAGRAVAKEIVGYTRWGEPRWLHTAITPVRDASGELTSFIEVHRDVTERHEVEAELLRAKQAAEETADSKAAFLASMSHEIRTPLNAVVGATELLRSTPLGAEQLRYAHIVQDSSRMLLALIDDILSYSALGSDTVELHLSPVRIAELLDNLAKMFQFEVQERTIELTVQVADDVPPWLMVDEFRMRQVLNNLVANAVKFTQRGSVRLSVALDEEGVPGPTRHVRFTVSDTGIGIDPDHLDRLFEPFTQEHPRVHRRFGGTGLGLAICRRIVEAMHGTITVESRPGAGSDFVVTVPLVATSAQEQQPPQLPEDPGVVRDEAADVRVLLVEDDALNELIAVELLAQIGCRPEVVRDAESALVLIGARHFDLVLTDIELPGMDGEELVATLRDRLDGAAPRMVALTANALPGDRERLLASGFDDYLSKPVSLAALVAAVDATRPGALEPPPVR